MPLKKRERERENQGYVVVIFFVVFIIYKSDLYEGFVSCQMESHDKTDTDTPIDGWLFALFLFNPRIPMRIERFRLTFKIKK